MEQLRLTSSLQGWRAKAAPVLVQGEKMSPRWLSSSSSSLDSKMPLTYSHIQIWRVTGCLFLPGLGAGSVTSSRDSSALRAAAASSFARPRRME